MHITATRCLRLASPSTCFPRLRAAHLCRTAKRFTSKVPNFHTSILGYSKLGCRSNFISSSSSCTSAFFRESRDLICSDKEPDDWDIGGLKTEAKRQAYRSQKKLQKATKKLREARDTVASLSNDEGVSLEQLEKCPDILDLEAEVLKLRERAQALNELLLALETVKSSETESFADVVALALHLEVSDAPPARPARGPKRAKGKPSKPRSPYFTYTSIDGINIRVGRKAEDNDELSCNPKHRDCSDWWMHAAGCPGSHVVIRFVGPELPKETLIDAGLLAVKNSKASQTSKAEVSLVRCRQVSKPPGSKAGLVHLSGNIRRVTVSLRNGKERLERLELTKR